MMRKILIIAASIYGQSIGVDKYIQQQLNPDRISKPVALTDRLSKLDPINLTPIELFQQFHLILTAMILITRYFSIEKLWVVGSKKANKH
jgi:hypothetical protein